MSDTPRTDAEGVRFARLMVEWPEPGKQKTTELIPADFARQLERELAEVTEVCDVEIRRRMQLEAREPYFDAIQLSEARYYRDSKEPIGILARAILWANGEMK